MSRASRDSAERFFQLDSLDLGVMVIVRGPRHRDHTRGADMSTLGHYWGGSFTRSPDWHEGNVWHTAIERRPHPAHRAEPDLPPVKL